MPSRYVAPSDVVTKKRLEALRKRVASFGYICSGTLHRRKKLCGKPTCACAANPRARHGPYYQWSRRKNGRQVNTIIPAVAVADFHAAIGNYRKLRALLKQWESNSALAMLRQAERVKK